MNCIRSNLNPHFFVSHIARAITLRAKEKEEEEEEKKTEIVHCFLGLSQNIVTLSSLQVPNQLSEVSLWLLHLPNFSHSQSLFGQHNN